MIGTEKSVCQRKTVCSRSIQMSLDNVSRATKKVRREKSIISSIQSPAICSLFQLSSSCPLFYAASLLSDAASKSARIFCENIENEFVQEQ